MLHSGRRDRFLSVESFRCQSHHSGWVRDQLGAESACLVIATGGVWMERDPDAAPVTVDAQTVSYRSVRSELWVQHTADHRDDLEIIRLRRGAELPAALRSANHATARVSMKCLLAQADLIAARNRGLPQAVVAVRLARLVELMLTDLSDGLGRQAALVPSHHHLAERVRFGADAAASRSHTSRVFKHATGMTLSHYRQRGRVASAIRRIASSDANLAQIAAEAGFADQAHLSRSLTKATGSTPSVLRARFRSG